MRSQTTIIVRYAETDQMGIAHHSHYPVWYEAARTDFIKRIGLTYTEMEHMGILLPLTELNCRYLGAVYYEDDLLVETRLTVLRRVKMTFAYTITRRDGDQILNEGRTVHGIVDRSMRPLNLAASHPQLFEQLRQIAEPE